MRARPFCKVLESCNCRVVTPQGSLKLGSGQSSPVFDKTVFLHGQGTTKSMRSSNVQTHKLALMNCFNQKPTFAWLSAASSKLRSLGYLLHPKRMYPTVRFPKASSPRLNPKPGTLKPKPKPEDLNNKRPNLKSLNLGSNPHPLMGTTGDYCRYSKAPFNSILWGNNCREIDLLLHPQKHLGVSV